MFNDWGGRGYDDSIPGEVTKTASSGDRTTWSPIWSVSLPRTQLIPPKGWSNMSPSVQTYVKVKQYWISIGCVLFLEMACRYCNRLRYTFGNNRVRQSKQTQTRNDARVSKTFRYRAHNKRAIGHHHRVQHVSPAGSRTVLSARRSSSSNVWACGIAGFSLGVIVELFFYVVGLFCSTKMSAVTNYSENETAALVSILRKPRSIGSPSRPLVYT